jgi:hypothetical protein
VRKEQILADTIFVLHGFLSPQECDRHVARAEGLGFREAALGGDGLGEVYKEVRDNGRVIFDDPELAQHLYERSSGAFPPEWFGWRPVGFNERWRCYRYGVGQRFAPHTDGCYSRETGEESQHTFLIYLNDDFECGSTNFYRGGGKLHCSVVPEKGLALVFAHRQLHEGAAVRRGRKYVLRTDVMYEPVTGRR